MLSEQEREELRRALAEIAAEERQQQQRMARDLDRALHRWSRRDGEVAGPLRMR